MKVGIELNQNKKNKNSGKKCSDYSQLEKDFQEAQDNWEKNKDKSSWDKMFFFINLAVFNNINKKLNNILSKEVIEERALDITITIMTSIVKKRENNINWKIKKLSSFVYLPCLAIYSEKLQFEDKILDEKFLGNSDIDYGIYKNGVYYL